MDHKTYGESDYFLIICISLVTPFHSSDNVPPFLPCSQVLAMATIPCILVLSDIYTISRGYKKVIVLLIFLACSYSIRLLHRHSSLHGGGLPVSDSDWFFVAYIYITFSLTIYSSSPLPTGWTRQSQRKAITAARHWLLATVTAAVLDWTQDGNGGNVHFLPDMVLCLVAIMKHLDWCWAWARGNATIMVLQACYKNPV